MLTTIEDITSRIIESYDPERIILFGSHAAGNDSSGSDIVLLILKDTPERPVERRMEVERLLLDRTVPIDLFVYTPGEVRYLYSIGSPFIEDIMQTGKVLYMRNATESWIHDARDELESAALLFHHEKFRPSCYHSQQCVEKGLKALIIESGRKPERIHDIVGLLNEVKSMGIAIEISPDDAVFLNSVYKGRYPTEEGLLPHGTPSREDAHRALDAAEKLLADVSARLG